MIEILTSWGFVLGLILMAITTFIVDSAYRKQIVELNKMLDLLQDSSISANQLWREEKERVATLEREIDQAGMVLYSGKKRTFLRKKRKGKDLTKKNNKK